MRIAHIDVASLCSFGPETKVVALRADKYLVRCVGADNAGESNVFGAFAAATRRVAVEPADFRQLELSEQIRVEVRLFEARSLLTGNEEHEVHE